MSTRAGLEDLISGCSKISAAKGAEVPTRFSDLDAPINYLTRTNSSLIMHCENSAAYY